MNKKQKRFIRWALVVLSIVLLMLVIILTPIMTEVVWKTKDFTPLQDASIALMVLIPILTSIIAYLVSEKFINRTLQDAKNKLENIYDYGYIEVDKYVEVLKYLDSLEDKKIKAKLDLATKKVVAEIESKKNVEKLIKEAKLDINKLETEEEEIEENISKNKSDTNYGYC